MIDPIAVQLNIDPHTHVVANTLVFDDTLKGSYTGFDTSEPTSQDMGKPRALQQILQQHTAKTTDPSGSCVMVMIGDGATDAQAKPPARAFIGFGGVVVRDAVRQQADWFVTDFDDLNYVVQHFTRSNNKS